MLLFLNYATKFTKTLRSFSGHYYSKSDPRYKIRPVYFNSKILHACKKLINIVSLTNWILNFHETISN